MRLKSGLEMHFWALPLVVFLAACGSSNGQDSVAGSQTPEERYKITKWGSVNTQTATGQILITNPRGTVLWSQQSDDGSVLRVVKRNLRRTSYDGRTNHIIDKNFALITRPDGSGLEFEIPITTAQQLFLRGSLDPDGTFVTIVQRKVDQLPNGYEKPLDLNINTATSLVKTIQERIQPDEVITLNETYTKNPVDPFSPRFGETVKEVDQVFAPSTEQSAGDDAQLVGPYHTILKDKVDADGNKFMVAQVPIQRSPDGYEVELSDASMSSHIKTVLRAIRPDGKVYTKVVRIPTSLSTVPVNSKKRLDDTPVPPEIIKRGGTNKKFDYPFAVGPEGKTPHRIFSDVVLSNQTRVITTRYKVQLNPDMSISTVDFDNQDPTLGVKTVTTWIHPTGAKFWHVEVSKSQSQKPEETKPNARIILDDNLADGTRKLIYRIKEARDLENKTIDVDYSDDDPETIVKEVTKLYRPSGSIKTHIVNQVQGIVFPEEAKKQARVYGRSDGVNGTRKVYYKIKVFKHPDEIETAVDYDDPDPNNAMKFVNKTYLPSGHVHSLIKRQRKRLPKVESLGTTTTTQAPATTPPNNIKESYITQEGTNVVVFYEKYRKLPQGQEEILGDDDKSPDAETRILVKKIYANGTVEITPQKMSPPTPAPSAQVLPKLEPEIAFVPTFAPVIEIPGENTPEPIVKVEPETATEDQVLPMLPTEDATELPTERPFEPTNGLSESPGGFEVTFQPVEFLPDSMLPSGQPDGVPPIDVGAFTFQPLVDPAQSAATEATDKIGNILTTAVPERVIKSTSGSIVAGTTSPEPPSPEVVPSVVETQKSEQAGPVISLPEPVSPPAVTASMITKFLRPGKPQLAPDTFEITPATCACSPGRVQIMPTEINPRREIIETMTEPDGTNVILYKVKMLIEPEGTVFELPKDDPDPAAVILIVMRHVHPDGSVESKIIETKPNNAGKNTKVTMPGFKVPPPPPPVATIYKNESIPVTKGKTEVELITKNSTLPTVPGQPGFLSNASIIIIDETPADGDGKRIVVYMTEVLTLPNGIQVYVRPDSIENGKKVFVLTEFLPNGIIIQKNITSEVKEHKVNVFVLPVVPSGTSIEGEVFKPSWVKNAVPKVPALEPFKTYEDLVIITHYVQQDGCTALLFNTRVLQNGNGTLKTLPFDDNKPFTYVITLLQRQCSDGSIVTYRVIGPSKEDAELNVDTTDVKLLIPVRPSEKIYIPENILVPGGTEYVPGGTRPDGNKVQSTTEKWTSASESSQPNRVTGQPGLSITTKPLRTSTRSPSEAKVTTNEKSDSTTQRSQSGSASTTPRSDSKRPAGTTEETTPKASSGSSNATTPRPVGGTGSTSSSGNQSTQRPVVQPDITVQIETLFRLLPHGNTGTIINFFVEPSGTKVIFYVVKTIRKFNEPDKILLPTDPSPEAIYVTYVLIQNLYGKTTIQEVYNPLQPSDPRFPRPCGFVNVTIPSTPEDTDRPKIPSPTMPIPKSPAPTGTTPDGINFVISNVTDSNGKEVVIGSVPDRRPSGKLPGQSIPQVMIVQEKYPNGTLKTFQASDPNDLDAVNITVTIPLINYIQIGAPYQTEEIPQKDPSHPHSPYNPTNVRLSEYKDPYGNQFILYVILPVNSENDTLPQQKVPITTIIWQVMPGGFVTTRQVVDPAVYSKPTMFIDITVKKEIAGIVQSKPEGKSPTQTTTQDPITALQEITASIEDDNGFVVTNYARPDGSFTSIVIYKVRVGPRGELLQAVPFDSPNNFNTRPILMLQDTYPNGTVVLREIVTPDKQEQIPPSQKQTQQIPLAVYPIENVYWGQNQPGTSNFIRIPEGSKILSTINQPDESILTIYLAPNDGTDDSDSDPLGRVYMRKVDPDGTIQTEMVVTPQTRPVRREDVLRNLTIWVKPSTTPQTLKPVRQLYKAEPDAFKIYIVRNITEPDGSKTSIYVVKVIVKPDGSTEYVPTDKMSKGTRWVTIFERIDPSGTMTWTEAKEQGKSWPVLPEFKPDEGSNCESLRTTQEPRSKATTELPSTSRVSMPSIPESATTTMEPERTSTERIQLPGSEKGTSNQLYTTVKPWKTPETDGPDVWPTDSPWILTDQPTTTPPITRQTRPTRQPPIKTPQPILPGSENEETEQPPWQTWSPQTTDRYWPSIRQTRVPTVTEEPSWRVSSQPPVPEPPVWPTDSPMPLPGQPTTRPPITRQTRPTRQPPIRTPQPILPGPDPEETEQSPWQTWSPQTTDLPYRTSISPTRVSTVTDKPSRRVSSQPPVPEPPVWSTDSPWTLTDQPTTRPPITRQTRPTTVPLTEPPQPMLTEPVTEGVPRPWPTAPPVILPGPLDPTKEIKIPPAPVLPSTGVPNVTVGTEIQADGSVVTNFKVKWTWRPDGSVEYLQPDDPRPSYESWYQEHIYPGGRIEQKQVQPPTGQIWIANGTKPSKAPLVYPNGTISIINEKWVYVHNGIVEDYDGDIYNPHLWLQVSETQIHSDGTITVNMRYEPIPNKPRVPPPPAQTLVIPLQPAEPGRKILGTTVRSDGSTVTYYYVRIIRNPDGTVTELSPEDNQPADEKVLRQRIIWLNKTQTVAELQKRPKEIEFHGFRPKEIRHETDGTVMVTLQRKILRNSAGSIRELDWSEDPPDAQIWEKRKIIKPSGQVYVEEVFSRVRKSPIVYNQILKHVYPNGTIIYFKNGQIISSSSSDAQQTYVDYSKYQKKGQTAGEAGSVVEVFERRYQKSTDGTEYDVAFDDNSEGTYIETVTKTTYENGDTAAVRKLARIPTSLTFQFTNETQTSGGSTMGTIRKIKKFPNGTSVIVEEEIAEGQLKPSEMYEAPRPPYPPLNPKEPVQSNPTYTLVEQKSSPDGAEIGVYEKRVRKYADKSEYDVSASDNTVNTFTKRVTITKYPNGGVRTTVSYVPVVEERQMEVSIINGNLLKINNVVRNMNEVLQEDSPEGHYVRKLYPQIQAKLRQFKEQ